MNEKQSIKSVSDDPMPLKIGVMGGAGSDIPAHYLDRAARLGEEIAAEGCVMITGACPGLPLAAAQGASKQGGTVIGISPALSLDEHAYKYGSPTLAHNVLIFTGSGLMGREVVNIHSSDIVVIVGGRSGTLGELAIAYDEGKLIGVLTGTGGISDMVQSILETCHKDTSARVIYNDDPQQLVNELLEVYRNEHFRRPSVFCRGVQAASPITIANGKKDIVCGMILEPGSAAARREQNGSEYVFCSLHCAEKFDAQPSNYLESEKSDSSL
ncbi:YHS domain-containing protein [Gimesia chilikensis]|uniref:YHS domain protein n=1 Tax=Gimesia chilikensis TaxID=2605989 RepID=A0A517PLP6_9PLAN|nr:YHS domain-containing protein [Gimesia chilikensis]QDT20295.1 YHS domain protein [Gimesia chilikensis]QDU02391.1 YHS domain protein [Gimesia chilikensis]